MFDSFVGHIRSETEVGVPRRFSIGSLFVLLTMYGVLFRLLVWLGADARWTGTIGLFFAAVMVGQMLLFHGVRPRAASMVTGALVCPAMLLVVVIDEMFTRRIGWQPLDGVLGYPQAFFAAMALLAIVGLALGYVVGGAMAGVFYVIGKVRPSFGVAGVNDATLAESHASRLSVCVGSIGRWINPIQPRSPWRGALAAFLIPVVLGFLISPFTNLPTSYHAIVFATGLGAALALWSGNFQVRFYWPIVLCSVVAIAAVWLAAALSQFPMLQDVFWDHPKIVRVCVCIMGVVVGLTISAVAGWSQWMIYRSRDNGRFGKKLLGMSVVLLFGLAWLAKAHLDAWVQSPRQQLFKEIRAEGGYIDWLSDWPDVFDFSGQTLYGVWLSENSDDEDLLKLLPFLSGSFDVSLRGAGFTNRSVAALEGMPLRSLALRGTSITDAAFSELTDFSADAVHLPMNAVGDEAVEGLTSIARMQERLGNLSLDNTKITDEVFLSLRACHSLEWLSLSHCRISDGGIKMLVKAVPKLRYLDLERTDITDEGLANLANLNGLMYLNVTNADITKAGIDRLNRALPKCSVNWSDSTAD